MTTESINPFEVCADNAYCVDTATVTELARIGASGDAVTSRVGGTYLRVLIARSRKFSAEAASTHAYAVDMVNREIYPAVLAGVTTADCCEDTSLGRAERSRRSLERNRRSNFARTAASTVRAWIGVGGDLNTVDVATITKADLIRAVAAYRAAKRDESTVAGVTIAAASTDRAEVSLRRAHRQLVRALRSIKSVDAERASVLCDPITRDLIAEFEER